MSATAKTALVVPALLIVLSVAWYFIAVEWQSNSLATLVTNSAFCALLAASVYRSESPSGGVIRGHARGTIVAIILGIAAAFVGAIVYNSNHMIGDTLMQSLSLGYYPPGPDAPFEVGAVIWSLSIAVLVAVGVAIGIALRKIATTQTAA